MGESQVKTVEELEQVLVSMRDGFGILEESLPARTLEHRVMEWLPVGTSYINPRLSSIKIPTLVVGGQDDNMLPTKKESQRLVSVMPNCTSVELPNAGHFALDGRVNLTNIIVKSKIDPMNLIQNKIKKDIILDWEKPDPSSDLYRQAVESRVTPVRKLVSPVFISTSMDGKR